jgi:1-acyl-sn-glycerol-3-phosphate acyltransferase
MPYQVPWTIRLARWILRPLFRGLFHLLSDIAIYGKENIPEQGSYLIAINHISLFEPPLVLAFWPVPAEAVGAVDIWDRPGQATLVRLYGGIPVHRGEYDRQLLDTMIAVLRSGRPLLIAPEGGRTHTPGLRRGLPGVAYVMDKTRVPVLPVGIYGSTDDFLSRAMRLHRPRLEMRIGQPLVLPAVEGRGESRREGLQRNVDLIMKHIASLLPVDYRGIYADEKISA